MPRGVVEEALESELNAMLQAGREREVIERLHREAGMTFRQATVWITYRRSRLIHDPPKPCPYCGELLRTNRAQQCFRCGRDWHPRPEGGAA